MFAQQQDSASPTPSPGGSRLTPRSAASTPTAAASGTPGSSSPGGGGSDLSVGVSTRDRWLEETSKQWKAEEEQLGQGLTSVQARIRCGGTVATFAGSREWHTGRRGGQVCGKEWR